MTATRENSQVLKTLYFEILRIIAIFFVIFDHTGEKGRTLFMNCDYCATYWISIALALLCKISVPLFFMISGALLLNKNEDYLRDIIGKRVVRMCVVLICISLIYYLLDPNQFSAKYFVYRIVTSQFSGTYWYIYQYILFLLLLPLYRSIAKSLSFEDISILFIVGFLFVGLLPAVSFLLWHENINPNLSNPLLDWVLFYPIVGYYIEHKLKLDSKFPLKKIAISASILLIAVLFVATIYTSFVWRKWRVADDLYVVNKFFVPIFTVSVFFIGKYLGSAIKSKFLNHWICVQGGCVFGVYLLDNILRNQFEFIYYGLVDLGISKLVSSLLWAVIIYTIGLGITYCVKLVPVVRKYI